MWDAGKKSGSTGISAEESPTDLSSSGEIGFLLNSQFGMSGLKKIDELTDWFGKIDYLLEHLFNEGSSHV